MRNALKEIDRVMRQTHGMDISAYDKGFLLKTLDARLAATGITTAAAYCAHLAECPAEAESLSHSLGIVFSEFFRNPLAFTVLEHSILPALLAEAERTGRAEIRVWSAGCAGGQEAYSVAILLDELLTARGCAEVSFRVFATDRSAAALASALGGVYDSAAVQNVCLKHLRRHFIQKGDCFTLTPDLGSRVDFSAFDLLDNRSACPPASICGDFDLVLCSNVLIYYAHDVRLCILDRLRRSLAPRGYLMTGEAERDFAAKTTFFRAAEFPAVPLFRAF